MKQPFIIAIAGGSASGKTSIASALQEALGGEGSASLIAIDSYYWAQDHLSLEQRAGQNYDHPDAFDWPLFEEHISLLSKGKQVLVPRYCHSSHTRSGEQALVETRSFLIVEGILTLYVDRICELYDLTVFVDCPEDVRFKRRELRDTKERGRSPESVYKQWHESVEPMYLDFCLPGRDRAQIKLSGTIDILQSVEKIKTSLPNYP